MERKLTAILSADVEGYSRLMGEDEEATIRTLTFYRQVMGALIPLHRGRVVDSPGDNLLAEFGSVVDAVKCAAVIQTTLRAENADLPQDRRMEFRIGINLGDVMVEGERIYGDGVNIAARVEGLAEGGGICISGTVFDQIKGKVSVTFEDLGLQQVKNIAEPIRAYRAVLGWGTVSAGPQQKIERPRRQPPTAEPQFAYPMVGRERELGILQQRVDAVSQGEGSLMFITGEAGIGKTRLAGEVRPYARGRGYIWLEGRYLKEGRVLFQPWIEAIRAFLHTAPPAMLEKVLMPYGAELAKLVPEVAERLERMPSSTPIGPEEDIARLFEALVGFFTGIAREQPLVIFVDDIQWATSLNSLHHLSRHVASERFMLLGAYRDGELKEKPSLSKALLAMNRERLFHTLPLKRLGEGEVAQMVTQTLGEAASTTLAVTVSQKTEGNPFFVEELVRYLTESGGITKGEKGWEVKDPALVQLPDSVKAVVEDRIEQLGEEIGGVLTWASVAGREFTLSLLKEVTGLEEDKLLDTVDKAVAARVLTPRPSLGQEAYTFVDQQTQDVLYDRIGPARRRRYHLKVGQGIEKVHGRRLAEHYDALAHHFLQGNDLHKAAEYTTKAGDKASTIYTWGRARSHYQTALELLEELEAEPSQQAELLEKLARVTGLGKGKGTLGYYEKALSLYEALGDRKKAGAVHLRLAEQYQFYELGARDLEKAYSHGHKAVALLEPEGESALLAWAYARLGFIGMSGHEPMPIAIELTEKGLAIAERLGDPGATAEAEHILGFLLFVAGEVKRSLELNRKSCERARKSGDLDMLCRGANALAFAYIRLADGNSALLWAEQAADAAKQAGIIRHQIHSAAFQAWASIIGGDVASSLSSLERAWQLAVSAEMAQLSAYAENVPPIIDFFLGDWEKAETGLKRFGLDLSHWLGQLYIEQGNIIAAKAHLREWANRADARGAKGIELVSRALLAVVTAKEGELEEAEAHLHRAKGILSNGEDWRGLAAQVHLTEGIVTTAEKKWQQAEEAFKKALEIHKQYPFPYYEAKCLFEWAQMYLSRNRSGDRERGMQLLDEALTIYQKIQAKKMVEKVLAQKQVLTV